jgi:hypothetical protein
MSMTAFKQGKAATVRCGQRVPITFVHPVLLLYHALIRCFLPRHYPPNPVTAAGGPAGDA